MTDRAEDMPDELAVAEAIRDGALSSPQAFHNVALFKLRITGTGSAYRSGLDEHTWRSPEDYLNDRFLQRCAGLPVLWEHPEKGVLNSKEFANRVVGSIMFGFIEGEDVVGIGKIYDAEAIQQMTDKQLSTSPGVVLRSADSETIKLKGDEGVLLIEGAPMLLDHLAICEAGVWDKGGPPTGVTNDALERVDSMAESDDERQARMDAEKARDAKLDKILALTDSVVSRQDAIEKRLDAEAKERKDAEGKAEEKAKADAKAKADWDEEEKKKADAAKAKADEDEKEEKKEEKEEKKDSKAKADEDEEETEEEKKARLKKEEEAKEKADSARADSAAERTFKRMMEDREKYNTPEEREAKAQIQARADRVYVQHGQQAQPPMLGETSTAYAVRMLKGMQKHSDGWKEVRLDTLEPAALKVAETQIYADAERASRNPIDIPDGMLIPIVRTSESGHRITEFRGRDTIFKTLSAPTQRVTAFLTEKRGA